MSRYVYTIAVFVTMVACDTGEKDQRTTPHVKDVSEYVYASASIVSKHSYSCKSPTAGIIEAVMVSEGDKVATGQVLFKVKSSSTRKSRLANAAIDLREVEDQLQGAKSQLKGIDLEIERVKSQLALDSLTYKRRQRLWDSQIGSKNDLERSLLAYQTSQKKLQSLIVDYRQVQSSLVASSAKARNLLASERGAISDLEVRAEIDGEVFTIMKERGEYITPQEVFAEIGSTKDFKVVMNIDEADISKVKLGDTAIVHMEAYPDDVYTAALTYISNKKDQQTQTFNVEADLINQPNQLFSGLAGEANILVDKRSGALTIPSDYLMAGNRVLTDDGIRDVRVGIKNLNEVEILQGIDSTTIVVKPTTE